MHLSHSFTIPAGLEETWEHFHDISSVAECFPGAKVTRAEGDDFEGTAKVKLGPVALQYSGSGSFIERDESAHRMVFEAKGKDKRGNGTAGATVTMSFVAEGDATRAEVVTDLSVTGRPAQFGQRMMQEVSDKLLGQFVDCLQHRVGSGDAAAEGAAAAAVTGISAEDVATEAAAAQAAAAVSPSAATPSPAPTRTEPEPHAAGAPATAAPVSGAPVSGTATPPTLPTIGRPPPAATPTVTPRPAQSDDALDLGATVLPVVARMYGKQVGAGVLALLLLWLLRRGWGRRGR